MDEFRKILSEVCFYSEAIAALTGLVYWNKVKNSLWKYFVIYLCIIFLAELVAKYADNILPFSKAIYYNYIIIPLQFIFFYWLYTIKALKKPTLFIVFTTLYLISFIPNELYFSQSKIVFSFNYTLGCLLLMILVGMEYYRQINSPEILHFKKNKMFYINIGVTAFYIGTLPYYAFYSSIRQYESLYKFYAFYVSMSLIIMYLLFAASFIWGKRSF